MIKPTKSSFDARFFALIASAGLMDLPILLVIGGRSSPISPAWACALHALASVAAFLAPPKEKGFLRPTRHWGEFLGLATLMIPGAGWLLGGWLAARHGAARHAKNAYRFDKELEEEVDSLATAGSPSSIRRELSEALDVVPAADALLGRDPALKRGAIEALGKIRSREAVAWILRARSDSDPEIRFFATAALTQLKRDFDTAVGAAEKEVFSHPGDLAPQLALQRIRFDYACSGLLEPMGRALMLDHCHRWLIETAERDAGALRLLFYVEKELDSSRALAALQRLIASEPDAARRQPWLREKAALLFDLGRFAQVRAIMAELRPFLLKNDAPAKSREEMDWRTAALWWTHA